MQGRGQVQVLAALLLLAITVSAWLIVWIWFYPQYWSTYTNLQNEKLKGEQRLSERLVVENIIFNSSAASLYVTNTGSIEVKVVAVYVDNVLTWEGEVGLLVDSSSWINVTLSPVSGRTYVFKLVSSRGNSWEVRARAP